MYTPMAASQRKGNAMHQAPSHRGVEPTISGAPQLAHPARCVPAMWPTPAVGAGSGRSRFPWSAPSKQTRLGGHRLWPLPAESWQAKALPLPLPWALPSQLLAWPSREHRRLSFENAGQTADHRPAQSMYLLLLCEQFMIRSL